MVAQLVQLVQLRSYHQRYNSVQHVERVTSQYLRVLYPSQLDITIVHNIIYAAKVSRHAQVMLLVHVPIIVVVMYLLFLRI